MVKEYYVSPLGDDSNPGTIEQPFKSIQQAVNLTAEKTDGEGRTIYLRGGTYDITEGSYQQGEVRAGIHIEGDWNGGSRDEPLTIRAYEDEKPLLDGSNVTSGRIGIFLKDVQNVDLIDLEIHSVDFHGIEVVNGKDINIIGNTVRDNQGSGIAVRGYLADLEGDGSTQYRSENVRVEGNKVYRNILDNSGDRKGTDNWGGAVAIRHTANVVVKNNEVRENYGEGIILLQSTEGVIENNRVSDNFSVNVYLDNASNSVVKDNFIYSTGNEDFFRGDGGRAFAANSINLSNEAYDNIENPSAYYQNNNTIQNNVLAGGNAGLYYGTYAGIHSNATESKRGLKNIRVVNNTFYDPQFAFVKVDEDPGIENVEFANNIFSRVPREGLMTDIDSNNGLTFQSNLWYGGNSFGGAAGSERISSPSDIMADPQFINPGGIQAEDYFLQVGSPAVDTATNIEGITHFVDNQPDIGAFEQSKTAEDKADQSTGKAIRIEAEDLQLDGYLVEAVPDSGASANRHLSLRGAGDIGSASGVFQGETGTYDVAVGYYDENDGTGDLNVTVAGKTATIALDRDLPSNWAQPEALTSRITHPSVDLTSGVRFTVEGMRDRNEYGRFDYIEFTPVPQLASAAMVTLQESTPQKPTPVVKASAIAPVDRLIGSDYLTESSGKQDVLLGRGADVFERGNRLGADFNNSNKVSTVDKSDYALTTDVAILEGELMQLADKPFDYSLVNYSLGTASNQSIGETTSPFNLTQTPELIAAAP